MREENPFEEAIVAKEWIAAIETEKDGSRDKEIYPLISKWIQEVKPQVVVEIGAGQGICSEKVDLLSAKYIGIEPSVFLVKRAQELYGNSDKTFLEGNAYSLPLNDSSTDIAFSIGVWFHIKDLDKAHQEAARILRSKGELFIVTSNPTTAHVWESFFEEHTRNEKTIEGRVRVPSGVLSRNIIHIHSEEEIRESLEKSGLKIKSIEKLGFGREYRDEGVWMAIRAIKE